MLVEQDEYRPLTADYRDGEGFAAMRAEIACYEWVMRVAVTSRFGEICAVMEQRIDTLKERLSHEDVYDMETPEE